MEVKNHELYPTRFLIGYRMADTQPQQIGTLIVKATFQNLTSPNAAPKDQQVAITVKDTPFEGVGDVQYESDFVPFKPYADIIILGAAQPPDISPNQVPTGEWFTVMETSSGQRIEKRFDANDNKMT
jgi:hypothetical protein